ncbi:hypothetical protein DFJ74DRAFT_155700 [Hyaloraphidium curvatum]|nr:hypothetical protein DFJ74DRAFT_155700 [Hyaloraphidium curvatum]
MGDSPICCPEVSLHVAHYSFATYIGDRFVSTDFIQHFGFSSDAATAAALSNRRTSFIHGKPGSAGDVAYKAKYNALGQPRLRNVSEAEKLGAIRPEHKLCVLLRTFKVDLPYAKLAAKSALKHIWHLNELVVVVVQKDLDLAQKAFEGKDFLQVRVVAEQEVLQNGHMQQKYTKLNADIYCPKDTRYVFHLDSDVVLTRPLLVRDVFFRGRPMVQYAPYESMPSGDRQWQAGTSSAVKQSVTLEFSR